MDASTSHGNEPSTSASVRGFGRIAAVGGLLVLSPFCAEYLIGDISILQLVALPFLIPLYGAAAVLIRESVRRTGHGWPSILLLGAAFGVFQAGIVDASLFNPNYGEMDLSGARVPLLDFGSVMALAFVMNHLMLSIGAPIALVEAIARGQQARPWLRRGGLVGLGVVYLGGCLLIGWDNWEQEHFYPSALQLGAAAVTVTALVGTAFALPRRPRSSLPGDAPAPSRVAVFVAVMTGVYFFVPPSYLGLVLGGTLVAISFNRLDRWSRRSGWDEEHRLAVVAGALFTGAWGAYFVGLVTGQTDLVTRIGNVAFTVVAAALVVWAMRSIRRHHDPCRSLASGPAVTTFGEAA